MTVETTASTPSAPPPVSPPPSTDWRRFFSGFGEFLLFFMAIVLPAITLVVEWGTGICGDTFFDPIPTPLQILLVALVPAANALAWFGLRQGWGGGRLRTLGVLNGAALAIALVYAILYLPLAPFALLALLMVWWYFGAGFIGLLPLSPLGAFIAGLVLRRRLIRAYCPAGARTLPCIRLGFVAGVVALIAAGSLEIATVAGLRMAGSRSSEMRSRGVSLLRRLGREDTVLSIAHGRSSFYDTMYGEWFAFDGEKPNQEKARLIYFLMTGRDSRHVKPRSNLRGLFGRGRAVSEDFEWDDQQGGTRVGGILKGLYLDSSRLDGTLDGDAATGYLEWTMTFRNESEWGQREARATVALPPGAVVSRLTLWINGEEREAAFGGRGVVREAYQKVVRARRDPVLVTTCGPDRLLVQCFPVEPKGGTMKMRLGLTVPLQPETGKPTRWSLRLPVVLERNFRIDAEKAQDVWIESRSVLRAVQEGSGATLSDIQSEGVWRVQGRLTEAGLWSPGAYLEVEGGTGEAWCLDTTGGETAVVQQTVTATAPGPGAVVLVVDGSAAMAGPIKGVAEAVKEIPEGTRFDTMLIGDDVPARPVLEPATRESLKAAADAIGRFECVGGRGSVRALEEAWDAVLASGVPGAVIWVHGSQPVALDSPEGLKQRFERMPNGPQLLILQTAPGADKVTEEMDGVAGVRLLPPHSDPAIPLGALFRSWKPDSGSRHVKRTREAGAREGAGKNTSDHLVRLWAKDEVMNMLAQGKPVVREEATRLALRHHLVTPVSGAVVLETAQQFRDAGLEPVPASSLPTVPEPEFWALAVLAAGFLIVLWRRRPRAAVS